MRDRILRYTYTYTGSTICTRTVIIVWAPCVYALVENAPGQYSVVETRAKPYPRCQFYAFSALKVWKRFDKKLVLPLEPWNHGVEFLLVSLRNLLGFRPDHSLVRERVKELSLRLYFRRLGKPGGLAIDGIELPKSVEVLLAPHVDLSLVLLCILFLRRIVVLAGLEVTSKLTCR